MILSFGRSRRVFLPVGDLLHLTRPREMLVIRKYLELQPNDKLLDVASGHGFWTYYLSRHCQQAVGIDLAGEAIRQARRHLGSPRCLFCVSRAERLPFPSNSFERVVSVCALEHFSSDMDALLEIRRVLSAKDGVLVMSVDSLSSPWIDSTCREWHRKWGAVENYYDLDKLRDRLQKAGFHVLESSYLLTSRISWNLLRWAQKYLKATAPFVPLFLLVSILADWMWGRNDSGCILVVKAAPVALGQAGTAD